MNSKIYPTEFSDVQIEAQNHLNRFRKEFGFPDSPPIPVELIAFGLFGLRVELDQLGDRIKGLLSAERKVICLNERCSPNQQRFAVAHEIGHWVLHLGNESVPPLIDDFCTVPIARVLGSTRARTKQEKEKRQEYEASAFARALLIPRPFLRIATEELSVVDADAIRGLAKQFAVSYKTMLIRIDELRKHLMWDAPLDLDALDALENQLAMRRVFITKKTEPVHQLDQEDDRRGLGRIATSRAILPEKARVLRQLVYIKSSNISSFHTHSGAPDSSHPSQPEGRALIAIAEFFHELRQSHLGYRNPELPSIIEFAGTPNAGKNTQLEIISEYLEDIRQYKVKVIDEGIRACDLNRHLKVERLYETVARVVKQLLQFRYINPGEYDFVFFNRGLFDRLAFLRTARQLQRIDEQLENVHTQYLLTYARLLDTVFVLLISDKESLQREAKSVGAFVKGLSLDANTPQQRDIHNEETLEQLNTAYRDTFEEYKSFFTEIYLSDGLDNVSIMDQAKELTDLLFPDSAVQFSIPNLLTSPRYHLYPTSFSADGKNHRSSQQTDTKSDPSAALQLSLFET